MPTPAAVRKAQDLGLDLVLVSPTAVPPVAKAIDYGQYQYEMKKKQHDAKKKQHVVQVKELKFRPNTDDHDYDFKKNHAIRFLQDGNRVKGGSAVPRTRNCAHGSGPQLLLRFAEDLTAYGAVDGTPRMEGRNAHILISPVKGGCEGRGTEGKAAITANSATRPGIAGSFTRLRNIVLLLAIVLAGCGRNPQAELDRGQSLVELPSGETHLNRPLVFPKGARNIKLVGNPSGSTLVLDAGFQGSAAIVVEGASNITLSGFSIIGDRGDLKSDWYLL